MKICNKCGAPKEHDEFYKKGTGLTAACKPCHRKYIAELSAKYRQDPDKRKRMNDSARLSLQRSDRDPIKRRKRLDKLSVWKRERYQSDPAFKLLKNQRNRVVWAFKAQAVTKPKGTLDLLECSAAELQAHLAAQFRPGMTIENYGKVWHIDHIIPCARFDLSNPEHVRACFHYTNLQPLFVADNRAKSDGDSLVDWSALISERIASVGAYCGSGRAVRCLGG